MRHASCQFPSGFAAFYLSAFSAGVVLRKSGAAAPGPRSRAGAALPCASQNCRRHSWYACKSMRKLKNLGLGLAVGWLLAAAPAADAATEWNPVRTHAVEIGPQADRLIVGFKATPSNSIIKTIA